MEEYEEESNRENAKEKPTDLEKETIIKRAQHKEKRDTQTVSLVVARLSRCLPVPGLFGPPSGLSALLFPSGRLPVPGLSTALSPSASSVLVPGSSAPSPSSASVPGSSAPPSPSGCLPVPRSSIPSPSGGLLVPGLSTSSMSGHLPMPGLSTPSLSGRLLVPRLSALFAYGVHIPELSPPWSSPFPI